MLCILRCKQHDQSFIWALLSCGLKFSSDGLLQIHVINNMTENDIMVNDHKKKKTRNVNQIIILVDH